MAVEESKRSCEFYLGGVMKKESPKFTKFKKWFVYYQKLFGVSGYDTYFDISDDDSEMASTTTRQPNNTVTVTFNPEKHKSAKEIQISARHEAIHLLVGRLKHLAMSRYITEDNLYEATEEVVGKLEKLIP